MYTFTYNDYTIQNDSNHTINRVDGLSRIPNRISSDVLTGGDGGNIWEQKFNMRPITIAGSLFGTSFTDYFTRWGTFCSAFSIDNVSKQLTINRGDGVMKYLDCKVIDMPNFTEMEGDWCTSIYEVMLKAENPFFYTANQTFSMVLDDGSGGFPIPSPVVTPIGDTVIDTLVINNQGDVSTYAKFTINGDCISPTITNITTSMSFTLDDLISSDIVEIYSDTTGLHVTKNGVSDFSVLVSGELPIIQQGLNILRFTAGSYSVNAGVVVDYTDKFYTI